MAFLLISVWNVYVDVVLHQNGKVRQSVWLSVIVSSNCFVHFTTNRRLKTFHEEASQFLVSIDWPKESIKTIFTSFR